VKPLNLSLLLLRRDQYGAQTHGGQVKDRGQAPTGPKSEEGWLAVIFPDCITTEQDAWGTRMPVR